MLRESSPTVTRHFIIRRTADRVLNCTIFMLAKIVEDEIMFTALSQLMIRSDFQSVRDRRGDGSK